MYSIYPDYFGQDTEIHSTVSYNSTSSANSRNVRKMFVQRNASIMLRERYYDILIQYFLVTKLAVLPDHAWRERQSCSVCFVDCNRPHGDTILYPIYYVLAKLVVLHRIVKNCKNNIVKQSHSFRLKHPV